MIILWFPLGVNALLASASVNVVECDARPGASVFKLTLSVLDFKWQLEDCSVFKWQNDAFQ